jgi:eukaryotic-like serine/threonine-protein kinase
VWAAFHTGLGREVALKTLRPERADAVAVQRFEREVRAMTELTHPNTVRVFDHGVTDDGLWYYTMELLEGADLATLVAREGPLPPARAVYLVDQACRALAEAHARGTIHRDLKPENLFVTRAGTEGDFIKVLDFGIAKVLEEAESATLTREGTIAGTPSFMSPESAMGRPTTAASDVYALGAVLYFVLAGRPPFEQTALPALLFAHVSEAPAPPSDKRGEALPEDLEQVVLRALEKQPEARYPDAGALAAALSQCACAGTWHPSAAVLTTATVSRADPDAETIEGPRPTP